MRSEWNALLEKSEMNNPFLTWEWMYSWWEVYGKKTGLCIFALRDNAGSLIGIAPFQIVSKGFAGIGRLSILEFIGTSGDVTSEYLGIIAEKDNEKKVIFSIMERLFEEKFWTHADLRHFLATASALDYIRQWLQEHSCCYRAGSHSVCPFMELPGSMDDFFAAKSANFRKKIKEYLRVARRDLGLELSRADCSEELSLKMLALRQLHKARWGKKTRAFKTRRYLDFHQRVSGLFLENNWLRLFFLKHNNSYIAGIYCFFYNNVYYYYQSGRDPAYSKYRTGFVLLALATREAISEGAAEFDFLTGSEDYKLRWAKNSRNTVRLCFQNPQSGKSILSCLTQLRWRHLKSDYLRGTAAGKSVSRSRSHCL